MAEPSGITQVMTPAMGAKSGITIFITSISA
jgi:hypothetical protein